MATQMMASLKLLGLLALVTINVALAQKRTLVLLQENTESYKSKFGVFFGTLGSYGFELDFKGYKESGNRLKEYDTYLYDHLIIFAPKAEGFGSGLDTAGILDFVDSGRNVIIAASPEVSDTLRQLIGEVGVDLDDRGTKVYDHVNSLEGDATLVAATDFVDSPAILGKGIKAPVLYRGIAQSVPWESELVTVALSAPVTSYSHDPRKSMPDDLLAGSAISLVSLVQARNNARVLVAGSIDMFTDELFNSAVNIPSTGQTFPKSGNQEFSISAARWALQDRGVIKADNMRHHLVGSSDQPILYRVNDEVEFLLDIHEYEGGKKLPYKADDVQIEFVMLDPYVRAVMTHNGRGTYSLRFKVPDVYGVFKYVIDYKHQGYSYVTLQHQVPVRPYKHNEYERFLVCAYPYYASALSTMAAFFVLGFFFLYHK